MPTADGEQWLTARRITILDGESTIDAIWKQPETTWPREPNVMVGDRCSRDHGDASWGWQGLITLSPTPRGGRENPGPE